MKNNILPLSLSIFFLAGFIRELNGQTVHAVKFAYSEASSLSPESFDFWIDSLFNNLNNVTEFKPDSIQSCVLARFSKGLFTSDDAVLQGVRIINKYGGFERKLYQKEMDYLNAVLGVLYKRDILKITLLNEKAALISSGRSFEGESNNDSFKLETYRAILADVEPLNLELTFLKMKYNLEIGDMLYKSMQNKKEADKHYTVVHTFPFWKIEDNAYFNKHRTLYINAVSRRLEVNRGNLKTLERLDIIPSAGELYPIWKARIEEVGGNWDDIFDE